ncbi:MAG: SdpI family protein [Oscillospiraceae bacterium]|nr:SdpI family protein [Oscillospiraceae bacterium]
MTNAAFFLGGIALPLVTMIVGFVLWKVPPGINNGFGFRTELSKSSDEAWYFAQRYCGRGLVYVSVPLLALSAITCGICCASKAGSDGKFGVILVIVLSGIAAIAAVNAATDQKLKTSFKETLEKRLNDTNESR